MTDYEQQALDEFLLHKECGYSYNGDNPIGSLTYPEIYRLRCGLNVYMDLKSPDDDESGNGPRDELTEHEKQQAKKFAEKRGLSLQDDA